MAGGLVAARNIRALFQGGRTGGRGWLERLHGLASLAGGVGREAHALAFLLSAILILFSPVAARAADGAGCSYLGDTPAYYDNGAYVITNSTVARPAPSPIPSDVSYAAGTVLHYTYSISDPSVQARLTYLPLSGLGIDIVPYTSTGGSGSFTLPADARAVTPSGTIPGAGSGGTVTWTVYCGVRATQAVTSASGTVGAAMSFTPVTASFGRGTYSYALSGGTLPTGLSFNTGTGAISGTPTAALASTTFTVTVTHQGAGSASQTFQLTVNSPVPIVSAVSPVSGPTGGGTSVTITGSGFSTANNTGAVLFGTTPATYTIDSNTQIVATAPAGAAGTVDITVTTPGGTSVTSAADHYTYAAAPTVTAVSPDIGPTGGATPVTITGSGFLAASPSGAVKFGANVATYSIITDTQISATSPNGAAGVVDVTVTTPGGVSTISVADRFTYVAAPVASSFTASAVAYNAPATAFSVAGHATNSPTSYAVGSATTANGGSVSVDSAGLATYNAPAGFRGNDSFTFTATNPGGTSSPATVTVPVSNPVLSSTFIGGGTRGTALSGVQINTSGGRAPYSCSTTLVSGALPAGTQLNSDCSVSGTPAASGNFTFTANVIDSSTGTGPFTQATGSFTLSIAAPTIDLLPAAGALPAGTVGTGYSQGFTASGGTAGYGYARTNGTLPPGLSLVGNAVSGTPTTSGTFDFDITATDSSTVGSGGPYAKTLAYRIVVGSGTQTISFGTLSNISLSSSPPPLSATASSGLTVSFASTTPAVCTVSGTTVTLVDRGLCSITASQAGDANWSAANDVVQGFTVMPATLVVTPAAATGLQVGVAYSQTNAASGGVAPYTFSLSAGAFVPGTSLNPATGTVSGTPTVAGSFSYIVQVADSQGPAVTATTPVTTVTIAKGNQTISFTSTAPTGAAAGGTPYTISAASSAAGLTVSYSRDGSSTGCDLTGDTVTFTGIGTCRINAHQSGDTNWNAAPQVQQSFAVGMAAPALTVSASDSAPALGASVTFTATLTGGASPTGTVTFKDGSTTLGTGTITGTTVTFSTTALAVGAHTITAEYGGDANNGAVTSAAITVTVGKLTPALTVSASSSAPAFGASVTFTATLAGGASPAGTVTFKDGATTLGTGTISGTTVTFSTTALAVGGHTITAEYGGDANNAAVTSAAITVAVGKLTPALTVSASDSAPALGASVTFTATLTGGASPTGTVTFKDGSTTLGTGTITGTTVTFSTTALAVGAHTITAEYAGDANNAAATSAAITVTVGKLTPTLTVSVSDSAPALGVSVTFTATLTGGASPTGTVTFKDGATTLGTGTISGTTATFSTAALAVGTHTITAEYAGDANNAAVISAAITVTVGKLTPTLTVSVSDSAPAFGASVNFTATLAGGASPSGTVTFKDGSTTLGTGTISGTTVTFSTTALAVGAHTITAEYAGDANNGAVTSAAIAVTVGKLTPVLTVSASAGNPALGASVSFTAALAGGASPTGTVTFKDGATALGTGTISGTTATFSTAALAVGAHTITAEYGGDANNAAVTSAAITVTVKQAVVFAFSPAAGALKEAMAGEDYSQPIAATGGTGTLTYALDSGTLPKGMRLLPSGEITGPLDADAEVKEYSFTIEVRDGGGAAGTASYTIKVEKRAVTVTDKSIDVSGGGSPNNVNLEAGATGGPFTSANLVFVEPANAGTASIVLGEFAALGPTPLVWYLKFSPNPAYSGTAKVGFTLTSALGISNTGTVTYKLGYNAAEVTEKIDSLVHGFVRSRQSMISSTIKVPGLLERRRMENASDPIAARMSPSETGFTGSFSSSLAQMESARDNADGASGGYAAPFNVWIDGTFMLHNREENDNRWGSFAMISLGADYLLSEKALLGLSLHYDRMTDPTDEDAKLTGSGWLAGPYASFEIGKGVFWDTSLLYGGSANGIDTAFWDGSFDTRRWMIDTSVTGGWQLDEDTVLTPKLRALYFSERVNDYAVKNAAGDTIFLEGFDEEQFRISLAAEVARSFMLDNDMVLTPKLGVTGGFSGLDGSGAFGSISAGLSLKTQNAWMIDAGLLVNIEGDGQKSVGAKAGVSSRF